MSNTPFESFDKFDQDDKFPHKSSRKILDDMQDDFDGVLGIVAGPGITVDSTDPSYPIITAIFDGSGGGSGGSGGLWVKAAAKQNIESVENDIMYTNKTLYGGIVGLVGNALSIRLTIAALPGSNSEGETIQAWIVPGTFTPSNLQKYPDAIGEPVAASFVRMYVNDEDDPTNSGADQMDHMEFIVDLTLSAFTNGKAQIVVLSDSGAYVLLEYTEENFAHLTRAEIITSYVELAAYRTGFTAGDVVTLEFEADAPVYSLLIWPFDASSHSMAWQPVEVVLNEPTEIGTVSITIGVTTPHLLNGLATTELRVSACRYNQPTLGILTDSQFVFDQRSPVLMTSTNDGNYNYPGAQTAIKGSEAVAFSLSASYANEVTLFLNSEIEQVTPGPVALTAGEATVAIRRSSEDFTGRVYGTMSAINFNNGKTSTSNNNQLIYIDIEGSSFADPVFSVEGGTPFMSAADVEDAPIRTIHLVSTVRLANPTGDITLPGLVIDGTWTSPNGYTWTAQAHALDSSTRGEHTTTSLVEPIVVGSLMTGAGSAVSNITGGYTISGFEQRQVTISTPFSDTLDLTGVVDIDYVAGLTVLDIAFKSVDFTVLGNVITFTDPLFYNANATGTVFVWVSQAYDPGP